MLRPNDREIQAIKGLASTAPSFFEEFLSYLERAKDFEAEAWIDGGDEADLLRGKCLALKEQKTILRSLAPPKGS